MVVAIIGGSGYIGRTLYDRFLVDSRVERVVRIGEDAEEDISLDLTRPAEFDYSIFDSIDQVIFTAAISSPDKCASDYDLAWKINVIGTAWAISEMLERKCRVLFLSSDAVFGDIPGAVYTEESDTRANTPYGKMKKEIEDRFEGVDGFKAIRLSYVVSAQDRFVTYCLACLKEQKNAEVFHPFYRNCTTLGCVLQAIKWLVDNWESYQPWVLNMAGPELVSRVRIVDEINRYCNEKLHYTVCDPGEKFFQNRPGITQMASLYIDQYGIFASKSFSEIFRKEMEGI